MMMPGTRWSVSATFLSGNLPTSSAVMTSMKALALRFCSRLRSIDSRYPVTTIESSAPCAAWPVCGCAVCAYACPAPHKPTTDRKSVVKGKSVSVRVAPGGRRIIKQKKKHIRVHTRHTNTYNNTHIQLHNTLLTDRTYLSATLIHII